LKAKFKAAHHDLVSRADENKPGQPGVNLGSSWGQSGVNVHCPTLALIAARREHDADGDRRTGYQGLTLVGYTFWLSVSTFRVMRWVIAVIKSAQVELKSGGM
jgi:hypothetical protein